MNNNPFLLILNVAWYLIKIGIRNLCNQRLIWRDSLDLEQIQEGAKLVLNKNSCVLSGGHTMIGQDDNPVVGFSIIGKTFKKSNNKIYNKDVVILTEKLGTGIIFAGVKSIINLFGFSKLGILNNNNILIKQSDKIIVIAKGTASSNVKFKVNIK